MNETLKEIKQMRLDSEWILKQSKKTYQRYLAKFSEMERSRASTCKEGKATSCLESMLVAYFAKHPCQDKEYHKVNKPCVDTLMKLYGNYLFTGVERSYFNKYFASQWLRENYLKVLNKVF